MFLLLAGGAYAVCSAAGAASASAGALSLRSNTSPLKIQTFTPITPYVVRASAVP